MGKIIETRNLYKNTINSITQNADNWLSFLKTASWNFKYSFEDQILIYAQNPNATACAEMEYWNEKLHRWVNKNANAIFVFSKDDNSLTELESTSVQLLRKSVHPFFYRLFSSVLLPQTSHHKIFQSLKLSFVPIPGC